MNLRSDYKLLFESILGNVNSDEFCSVVDYGPIIVEEAFLNLLALL